MRRIPLIRASIVRPGHVRPGVVHRVGYLTPYLVQTIAEDVRRSGRVEIEVAADTDDAALAWVRDCCAGLRRPRIQVVFRGAGPTMRRGTIRMVSSWLRGSSKEVG